RDGAARELAIPRAWIGGVELAIHEAVEPHRRRASAREREDDEQQPQRRQPLLAVFAGEAMGEGGCGQGEGQPEDRVREPDHPPERPHVGPCACRCVAHARSSCALARRSYCMLRRAGRNPAWRMWVSICSAVSMKWAPACETTFSSIITEPKSLAPNRSATSPISGPSVGQLTWMFGMLSR